MLHFIKDVFALTSPDQRLQQTFPLPGRSQSAEATVATYLADFINMRRNRQNANRISGGGAAQSLARLKNRREVFQENNQKKWILPPPRQFTLYLYISQEKESLNNISIEGNLGFASRDEELRRWTAPVCHRG